MRDDLDGLREIDEDRALAPPQDVERGEVTVDAVDRDNQRELVEQLVPHAQRDRRREVDLRETRRRALGVADEGHEITVVQALDRRRYRHAGAMEEHEPGPLLPEPARVSHP